MSKSWHQKSKLFKQTKRIISGHILDSPFEPVLHASPHRMVWLGIFAMLANAVFWYVWTYWFPQPFESIKLRFLLGSIGFVLIYLGLKKKLRSGSALLIVGLIFWVELPFFTSLMYYLNGRNSVWLATIVGIILIYHTITDWRIATVGTFFAMGIGYGISELMLTHFEAISVPATTDWRIDAFVIGFAWSVGIMLGFSAASRQRELLNRTLATIGIMAHELRTPLSSIGLVANSLDKCALKVEDPLTRQRIQALSAKTQSLAGKMNRQIDTQIVNARFETLPIVMEPIQAWALVQEVMLNYPFKSVKESNCWRIELESDFCFEGPKQLVAQVITNLVKNAVVAIERANVGFTSDSILIGVSASEKVGYITIQDRGIGIAFDAQKSIFEPFFSTNQDSAHGLGLTFCKKVIRVCKGKISVSSQLGEGATFRISLPINNSYFD